MRQGCGADLRSADSETSGFASLVSDRHPEDAFTVRPEACPTKMRVRGCARPQRNSRVDKPEMSSTFWYGLNGAAGVLSGNEYDFE